MATTNSDNYAIQAATGFQGNGDKAAVGDIMGRMRIIRFSVTSPGNVNAISDIFKLCVLPANSRVVDWKIISPSLGTTGIFKIGNAVSVEGNELADDDAFGSGYDAGGQAVEAKPAASGNDGWMKKFTEAVDIQLVFTEATDAANGDIIQGYFAVVVD
jgi:hypothetical protein